MKHTKNEIKGSHWFIFGVGLIIIYKILDNFTGVSVWIGGLLKVLKPFLMSVLLAYLLYIPCRKVEKIFKRSKLFKKRARGLSVLVVYVIALLLIILLINTLIPTLTESIMDLAKNIPSYYETAMDYVNEIPEESVISKETVENIISKVKDIRIEEILTLENISMYIEKAVGLASGVFNIIVTIIVSIYILLERTAILNFLRRLVKTMFPQNTYRRIDRYFIKGNTIFFKYVSSQVLDAVIVGIIMSVALTLMYVKYAILLGFMIGLFNLIPFFGAIIAVALAALITLFTGGFTQALWVIVVLVILQQIDANIINPKVVGDALEISKILIILSVTVAGAYFGILGMFLGVPVVAVIKMMIDDYIESSEEQVKELS